LKRIVGFILIFIVISGCTRADPHVSEPIQTELYPHTDVPDLPSQTNCGSPKSLSTEKPGIEIYFTNPTDQQKNSYFGGVDECIVNSIEDASFSIDIAMYNINLWSIRNALIEAYQRGIQIRIVVESENLDNDVPRELRSAGIPVIGDRREGLMHNKFMIIDGNEVWTGSANFTLGSFYYDKNNLVHFNSVEIAQDYTTEFDEMFDRNMFGSDMVPDTPFPMVILGDDLVEIYFSPDDHVASRMISLIDQAKESIYFMAYSFTSNALGSAIVERIKSGVYVEGIMDQSQVLSNTGTEYDPFLQAAIKIYPYATDGLMHNKVIIIDRKIVITGSYNFSRNAEETNDENVVVIHDNTIAEEYLAEFAKIISSLEK